MRIPIPVLLGLFIVGIGAMVAGDRLSIQVLFDGGLALFGVGFLAAGIDGFLTRRVGFAGPSAGATSGHRTYRGKAALCWGIVLSELGLAIISVAVVQLLGIERAAIELLIARPGILFLGAGIMLACIGGASLLDPGERRESIGEWLLSLPFRMVSTIPVVLGLAIIAIGLVEVLAPDVFDAWLAPLYAFFSIPSDSLLDPCC